MSTIAYAQYTLQEQAASRPSIDQTRAPEVSVAQVKEIGKKVGIAALKVLASIGIIFAAQVIGVLSGPFYPIVGLVLPAVLIPFACKEIDEFFTRR
jgi:hypothetical protein